MAQLMITGVSGLLGSNVALVARDRGWRAFGVSGVRPARIPDVDCRQVDLRIPALVSALIRDVRPRWIVHCAAATNVDWCEEHPTEAMSINADATHSICVAAAEIGAGVVYISTDSVFRGDVGSYTESDIPEPVNTYARSKLAGEAAVAESGVEYVIVRTNIFGWSPDGKSSLAEWVIRKLRGGEEIAGFSDIVFNPVLATDLADVLLAIIGSGMRGVFHAGAPDRCSKYDFALFLAERFRLNAKLIQSGTSSAVSFVAPRPRNSTLQTLRLDALMGHGVFPSISEAIGRMCGQEQAGYTELVRSTNGVSHG